MAGARTAPAFTGTPTHRRITFHLIDASGDTYAESFYVPAATLPAEVEQLAADYQSVTQASLYDISDSGSYLGDADPDNAMTLQRNSIKQGINLLFKDVTTLDTVTPRIVAPVPEALQGNQDIPLLTFANLSLFILQFISMKPSYNLQSAQYTERRERANNPRVK